MRARHQLKRAAPMALLASLTLVSTPGVAVAATDSQPAQPRAVQVQQSTTTKAQQPNPNAPLEQRIASAERALQQARDREAAAREELDAAVAAHERATGRAAEAQQRVDDLEAEIEQTQQRLDAAARRVEQFAGSEYRFGSLVGPVLGYLSEDERAGTSLDVAGNSSADPTSDLTDRLEAQQDAELAAEAKLKQTRNAEKKAANTLAEAEKAHGATVADLDAAQARVDELAAEKAARTPGGAAAPAAGVVQPAQGEFTSGYGARWGSSHLGIDVANDIGTPIVAAHSGTVISSGPASGFGLWVRVQRDDGLTTLYGHINKSLVSVGQRVEAGQEIAKMGNRGQSTGPHLHFGVVENGQKIDPQEWLGRFGLRY